MLSLMVSSTSYLKRTKVISYYLLSITYYLIIASARFFTFHSSLFTKEENVSGLPLIGGREGVLLQVSSLLVEIVLVGSYCQFVAGMLIADHDAVRVHLKHRSSPFMRN